MATMRNVEIKLMNVGKGLLNLPSSTPPLLNLLDQTERLLMRVLVQPSPPKSLKQAMQPTIQALIAKQLMTYPDMDVNISVARCISEVMRILVHSAPYNDKQMKEFFELAVITFEKLSSASGGCYDRVSKVIKTLSRVDFFVLMSDLQLDGLIVRLFKQFLTFADANSCRVIFKMNMIMTKIIEGSEPLNLELVNLLVTSVREENQITSPLCWQLASRVMKQCAVKLRPHLPVKVAKEVCGSLRKVPNRKRKLESLVGSRNLVQTLKHCIRSQNEKEHEKETFSFDDSPMLNKSVTKMKENPKRYHTRGKQLVLPSVLKKGKRKRDKSLCKKSAQSVEHGENIVGSTIKVWWPKDNMYYQGVVKYFDSENRKHKLLYDDGDEELLDLEQEQWELVENVSLISDFELTRKVSSPDRDIICVQGYRMKQSYAPILEAIFKKHGDIAADCAFKTPSMRASLLEIVCEVVGQIQTNDFTTVISEMEELESHVSDAEAANINVTWLQAHLEAIHKTEKAMKKSVLVMKMKVNTSLVIRAGQKDLKEITAELVAAQERLEKGEKFVKVLKLVEKNVNENILEAPIPEAIFKKHGDITSGCVFKSASVRASFLVIICKLFGQVQTVNITTTISEMKKIENQLSDAEALNVNVSWLRGHLEFMKKSNLLKRAAQMDLIQRLAEVISAQERFEKAERCVEALNLVEQKLNDIVIELKAEKESWENQLVLYVNELMLDV